MNEVTSLRMPSGDGTLQIASLSLARSPIVFSFGEARPPKDVAKWIVNLQLSMREELHGSSARVEFRRGGISLGSVSVPRFGATKFSIYVDPFDGELPLDAFVSCDFTNGAKLTNAGTQRLDIVSCAVSSVAPISDRFGHRRHLVETARSFAKSVGLVSQYTSEGRAAQAAETVAELLTSKTPFSVIRLGDGEGRLLGYPENFSQPEMATEVLYYHFGPASMRAVSAMGTGAWVDEASLHLKSLLRNAMQNASNIGVPVFDYFRKADETLTAGHIGYACATVSAMNLLQEEPVLGYVGTNYFQQLGQTADFFPAICRAAAKVTLVGPWDLRSELSAALAIEGLGYIEVPRHYTWTGGESIGQYPSLYKIVESRIEALGDVRGQLFLVGAGLLGKHYCELLRQQGGVALDIGSVFDSWAKKGRPDAVRSHEKLNIEKLRQPS